MSRKRENVGPGLYRRILADGTTRFDISFTLGGKLRWECGFRTRTAARRRRTEVLASVDRGSFVETTRKTFGQYADEWLATRAGDLRPSTWASYHDVLTRLVPEALRAKRLQNLGPEDLGALFRQLHAGGLGATTVRYIHTIVRAMLNAAVANGHLMRNVATLPAAKPPKPRGGKAQMKAWTAEELDRFLAHVAGDRLYAAWFTLATTGLRRGELLGLRWQDVDLQSGRLAVRQTLISLGGRIHVSEPKSGRPRTLPLDPDTVAALRAWRVQQAEGRLLLGDRWQDTGLVFTTDKGLPLHPDRLSGTFARRVAGAGLPRIRLHDVRHTYATLALNAGVHPKVVQERLGHSSISITLDIYSHVQAPIHEKDADAVPALLRAARAAATGAS